MLSCKVELGALAGGGALKTMAQEALKEESAESLQWERMVRK